MQPRTSQIRVLVVDDSVVMRRVVARALERDPHIATTDFAADGRIALAKIAARVPDLVVLDLEMPVLDGLATLRELRRTHPRLPVLVFSSIDERSARAALDSLSLGATDFVVKPTSNSLECAEAYVAERLTPLIKALVAPCTPVAAAVTRTGGPVGVPVEAIVIGVSTGGPDALHRLMTALPADLPVPVLVVQHMPAVFTRLLAERLDRGSPLSVSEAQDGDVLEPGHVLIAPGQHHLGLARRGSATVVALNDEPPENSCRPSVDVLFRAAAKRYGGGVLAVVLTGMGRDGLRGCATVRAAGGQVVVQNPATAVIGSMPAAVADAGLAQAVLDLDDLVPELLARVRQVS